MKKLHRIGRVIMLLFVAGCSRHDVIPMSAMDIQVEQSHDNARTACYQSRERATVADLQALAELPKETLEKIMMLKYQNDAMVKIIGMVTGNTKDECDTGKKSWYDVEIAAHQADAKMNTAYTETATKIFSTGLMYGAIGYGVHEVMGAAGSSYTAYDSARINADSTQVDSQNDDHGTFGLEEEGETGAVPMGDCASGAIWHHTGCSCNSYKEGSCGDGTDNWWSEPVQIDPVPDPVVIQPVVK